MPANQEQINETLQKGIRAARRGYKEPAQRLLAEVLYEDSNNEEAWSWLYRVTDRPEQRLQCLERILAINPDNAWAKQEMTSLQAGTPSQEAPSPAQQQPTQAAPAAPSAQVDVSSLKCANCGAALQPRGGASPKTLVCDYCGSVLDLSRDSAAVVGQIKAKSKPTMPIEPGMEATFDGQRYQVIGWIRYEGWDDEDRWRWDEWLLVSSAGQYRWLSYDTEEGFVLQHKTKPTKAFNPHIASLIPVSGGMARVTERAMGRILTLAGELTWRAKVGERFNYADAVRGKKRYSIEYTQDEVELYEGEPISDLEIWQAFGREDLAEKAEKQEAARANYRILAIASAVLVIISCLGALVAAVSGRQLLSEEVQIRMGSEGRIVGPFEVTQPGRPHRVSLSTSLPTNNWAVVDVTAYDLEENEFYLAGEEFWDEEGRDSEGYWHESDVRGSQAFRPDQAGPYYLELSMEEATVESVTVQVKVEDSVMMSSYLIVFAVLCIVLTYVFASLSAKRMIGQAMLKAMAEED